MRCFVGHCILPRLTNKDLDEFCFPWAIGQVLLIRRERGEKKRIKIVRQKYSRRTLLIHKMNETLGYLRHFKKQAI
jgi:hypothetical protein